jgi:hypothetical protein
MRFDSVKELKGEVFRRLTGIQRNTFEAMAAVLSDAKCKQNIELELLAATAELSLYFLPAPLSSPKGQDPISSY